MEIFQLLYRALFDVTSIWSVVAKGVIWFIVAFVIIASTDSPNPEKSLKNMKTNLGFLVLFLLVSGGLLYFLFGQMVV